MPALEAKSFIPTKFATTEDKAWFCNALLKFLANDCPEGAFTKRLYHRLSLTFGNIAHYDKSGFYSCCFNSTGSKIAFLHQIISWPTYGGPDYTYCDVERVIIARIKASGLLACYQSQLNAETQRLERAQLARLKAKYETAAAPTPATIPARRQSDLFDLFA
jgi:hypothetical protein